MQPLVRSVMHPTDFSPASERAFAHALAISLLRQTYLHIVHVSPRNLSKSDWTQFPAVRQTLERWNLLDADSPRSAVLDELQMRVTKRVLKSRFPVLATKNLLEQEACDLIVVATEGREGPSRWIDRSNAEAMARWAQTMTLFVPADAKRGLVSLDTGELSLNHILVPVDKTPDCKAAVEFAQRTAKLLSSANVDITLLHVGTSIPPDLPTTDGPDWTWHRAQREGQPVAEILSAADSLSAELIIMATEGHDSVLDALRGSTTEQIIRRSPCPVLAVPATR